MSTRRKLKKKQTDSIGDIAYFTDSSDAEVNEDTVTEEQIYKVFEHTGKADPSSLTAEPAGIRVVLRMQRLWFAVWRNPRCAFLYAKACSTEV